MGSPYEKIDQYILEWLAEEGPATPREICEQRRRENVTRTRCRSLADIGLVSTVSDDVFSISEKGLNYLKSDYRIENISRAISLQPITKYPLLNTERRRITSLGVLDPEDIIYQNIQFLEHVPNYGKIQGNLQKTRDKINNVREGDLNRVMKEFPLNEPLDQQCAHWIRAFAGLHFFPDANHRTAMATLSAILESNGFSSPKWSERGIRRAVVVSKLLRILHVDIRFDNLWVKDEHYRHWLRYFRNHLFDTNDHIQSNYPVDDLEKVLEDARRYKTETKIAFQ